MILPNHSRFLISIQIRLNGKKFRDKALVSIHSLSSSISFKKERPKNDHNLKKADSLDRLQFLKKKSRSGVESLNFSIKQEFKPH
jgi:hypothetical protein